MKRINILTLASALIALFSFNSCAKNDTAASVSITTLTCASATFSATPTIATVYSGTATVPYVGGNGVTYSAGTAISSIGVTGLTATLSAGTLQEHPHLLEWLRLPFLLGGNLVHLL
jgi:hypothetical protein